MDQVTLKNDLVSAERKVTASEQHLARQRQIVAERKQEGFDLGEARRLLQLFEQLLTLHIAERDRLRKELGLRMPQWSASSSGLGRVRRPQIVR